MRTSMGLGLLVCGLLAMGASACGSATRALVHEEDVAKVFPWPGNKQQVTIRVKPKTFWVNTCSMLGSYEEVQVDADTTFYLVDELDKKFAYTPSRSPIRRLAPVESMEIRWPVKARKTEEAAPGGEGAGTQGAGKEGAKKEGAKKEGAKKEPPPTPKGG